MSLFIEFHLIQNFAPSNLNRDDTGAPKDAIFGGYRRARISSQCLKRAVRMWFKSNSDLSTQVLGVRTQHLERMLGDELRGIGLTRLDFFNELVMLALKKKSKKSKAEASEEDGNKVGNKEDDKLLSYLLFVSPSEINEFKKLIVDFSEEILILSSKKKIDQDQISKELKEAIKECLRKRYAVDIGLFGRMIADLPEANQDAACQVAHAISTHRVDREFDYFTAVDERRLLEEAGAGMLGQVEFNSATFYRYTNINPAKLLDNLQGDRELLLNGLRAFTLALVRAIPTGKQNTFAAHNPPSFIGVVIRHASPINLANAFETPVYAERGQALTKPSVIKLAEYDNMLSAVYGDPRDCWAYLDLSQAWPQDKGDKLNSLTELADWVAQHIANAQEA